MFFREALVRAFRVPVCLPQTVGLSAAQTFGKGQQMIGQNMEGIEI